MWLKGKIQFKKIAKVRGSTPSIFNSDNFNSFITQSEPYIKEVTNRLIYRLKLILSMYVIVLF